MNGISYGVPFEMHPGVFLNTYLLGQTQTQNNPVGGAVNAVTNTAGSAVTTTQNAASSFMALLPSLLTAIAIFVVGWILAGVLASLTRKLMLKLNLEDKAASVLEGGGAPPLTRWVSAAVYWIVLATGLVFALNALQLQGVSGPLSTFLQQIISFVPKLVLAAALIFGAWFSATLVKTILTRGLTRLNVDSKLSVQASEENRFSDAEQPFLLSNALGDAAYWFVWLFFLPLILGVLDLQGPLAPVQNLLNQFLGAIPNLLYAVVIVGASWFIGNIAKNLLTSLLTGVGFNNVTRSLGLTSTHQNGNRGGAIAQKTPSEYVGLIAFVGVMVLGIVAAVERLNMPVLSTILSQLLAVAGQVLVGAVVFAIGLWLANWVYNLIAQSGTRQADLLGQAARVSILAFAGAMALARMGVATNIVNLAFGLLLGAIAVAIALAFGLGGRDVAGEQLRGWLSSFNEAKNQRRETPDRDRERV
jgi:hypothetical protein